MGPEDPRFSRLIGPSPSSFLPLFFFLSILPLFLLSSLLFRSFLISFFISFFLSFFLSLIPPFLLSFPSFLAIPRKVTVPFNCIEKGPIVTPFFYLSPLFF